MTLIDLLLCRSPTGSQGLPGLIQPCPALVKLGGGLVQLGFPLGQLALALFDLCPRLNQILAPPVEFLLGGCDLGHARGVLVGQEGLAACLGFGHHGIDLG